MTSSILTTMFVCMGVSLCAKCDACEFDDDLIRHFRVIRRAQCMNSPFAMSHIPILSLIMPQLVQKRPCASKHLKMSSAKMGPFCPGVDAFRNICISPYPPYWYHSLSPFALWRHYMETWGIQWVNGELPSQRASHAGFDIFFQGT